MRLSAALTIFLLLLLSPQWAVAQSGAGEIKGQLVNKSQEGGSSAEVPLRLNTYLRNALQGSAEGKTDAQGSFLFKGLATERGYSYQVAFNYQGADYTSDRVWFDEGQVSKAVEIPVYNPTASDESIKVAASHTIIYVREDSLLVKEFYLFRNQGDKAYIGSREAQEGRRETLKLILPLGATGLQYSQGLTERGVVKTDNGFIDTMAVEPGEKLIGFSYILNGSREYTLTRTIAYPVDTLNILIEDKGIEASSPQLQVQEPLTVKEGRFLFLTGANLPRGATNEVSLRVAPPQMNYQKALPWAALALAMVLGMGAGYFLLKRRPQTITQLEESPASERERLLREIARLDDQYELGTISEEDYRSLRSEKKARLLALPRRARGEGN